MRLSLGGGSHHRHRPHERSSGHHRSRRDGGRRRSIGGRRSGRRPPRTWRRTSRTPGGRGCSVRVPVDLGSTTIASASGQRTGGGGDRAQGAGHPCERPRSTDERGAGHRDDHGVAGPDLEELLGSGRDRVSRTRRRSSSSGSRVVLFDADDRGRAGASTSPGAAGRGHGDGRRRGRRERAACLRRETRWRRLPPMVPVLRIWGDPTVRAAWASAGSQLGQGGIHHLEVAESGARATRVSPSRRQPRISSTRRRLTTAGGRRCP